MSQKNKKCYYPQVCNVKTHRPGTVCAGEAKLFKGKPAAAGGTTKAPYLTPASETEKFIERKRKAESQSELASAAADILESIDDTMKESHSRLNTLAGVSAQMLRSSDRTRPNSALQDIQFIDYALTSAEFDELDDGAESRSELFEIGKAMRSQLDDDQFRDACADSVRLRLELGSKQMMTLLRNTKGLDKSTSRKMRKCANDIDWESTRHEEYTPKQIESYADQHDGFLKDIESDKGDYWEKDAIKAKLRGKSQDLRNLATELRERDVM